MDNNNVTPAAAAPQQKLTPFQYYARVWQKFADGSGRANRPEYWYFVLFNIVIAFVLGFVDGLLGLGLGGANIGILGGLYSLAAFIPGIAVSVRRLHDSGKSGWLLLLALIPFLGALIIFVFTLLPSDEGENKYGAPSRT